MNAKSLLLIPSVAIAACSLLSDPDDSSQPPVDAHGLIVGFVRDTAGRGVRNVKVCGTTVLTIRGTPVMLSNLTTTTASGAYYIPFDFGVDTNTHAGLTVTATPPMASGLAPSMQSGLTLLIAVTPPPAETTHAVFVVSKGTPYDGYFCTYGP